ncbi:MAG: hypothetical protein FWH26_04220 [Oscillospiraceae bacterium]|nr:hypothetical protein [Oscillospiraceae bacterium]
MHQADEKKEEEKRGLTSARNETKLDSLLRKWKLSKWQALVIAAGVLGILLLCLSSLPGRGGRSAQPQQSEIRVDLTEYEARIERRLEELVAAIDGAGEARVMLTLDCGSEPVYAVQGKNSQSSSVSEDGSQESLSAEKAYVIIGSGGGEQGLVLKTIEPKVRGAAVLCQGADDMVVRQNVIEAVTAVLGVGSNKVSVARLAG